MSKIALVTPLKNERDNIDALYESIANQGVRISTWVIVENGSDDGSAEILASKPAPGNVDKLIILSFRLPQETYALGVKYSTVVNHGFTSLLNMVKVGQVDKPDYVGILDADCFPNENYYSELTGRMAKDGVAISSGVGVFDNGEPDGEAKDWVRGNCRLWTWECFSRVGYVVGPSADTLSLTKAVVRGYTAKPHLDLIYRCREMGKKSRYDYYGYSSYYRGVTLPYVLIRALKIVGLGRYANAREYLKGYLKSYFEKAPRIQDPEIFDYFQTALYRKLKSLFG